MLKLLVFITDPEMRVNPRTLNRLRSFLAELGYQAVIGNETVPSCRYPLRVITLEGVNSWMFDFFTRNRGTGDVLVINTTNTAIQHQRHLVVDMPISLVQDAPYR